MIRLHSLFHCALFNAACLLCATPAMAAPPLLNHQGRMAVNGINFEGTGQFKFALVNGTGAISYWSNDGTSAAGSQPTAAVSLTVTKGLYAVLLGDTALTNMTAVPASVFSNADVRLRVWFNDGTLGFQQITPDQRFATAPYAFAAEKAALATTVEDGAITAAKIAPGAVTNGSLGNSALTLTAGTGLSGGGSVSLGGSVTLSNAGVTSLAAGGGVTVSGGTGAITLGSNATSANTPGTIVKRDASGNFAAGTITGVFVGDGSGLTGVTAVASQVLLSNVVAPPIKPVPAWGRNNVGQTSVPVLSNVAAVAAGSAQSLALLKTGTVLAWGTGPAVPGTVVDVTRIAAGTAHFLARKSDGTVLAWGDNTYAQAPAATGIANAINVSAGEKHSLALLANGTVAAWGDNSFNQTTIPGTVTNITAIAAGYDHSLALTATGSVFAWGRNDCAQCDVPGGLANVVAIAAGAYHSLAVKADGSVVAWGWNSGGQITVPPGLGGVIKVAGGYTFSVALKNDGTLVAWGDNAYGQTTLPADAVNVTALAAGANHALALRADLIPAQVARLDQDNVLTGKLGIQRTAATNALEVEGNASKSTGSNWLTNSDRRIKTDIEPLTGALEKLDLVRLVDFRYTADYRAAHPGIADKRYLNVVAQEFAEVFPDHVQNSGEKLPDGSPILQVDTYPLTIYSAAAVQELHRMNESLKKQLADQEQRLLKLEAALHEK